MQRVRVLDLVQLTDQTFKLKLERPDVVIKAGQCFNIGLPGQAINREYSMYSDATANYVEFLVRVVDDGIVSPKLADLKKGDQVDLAGPFGEFCVENSLNAGFKKFLFIATGTGVAPFRSFVKTFPGLNFVLLHGIRHDFENYDASDYPEGRYFKCVSQPNKPMNAMRVTDRLGEMEICEETMIYLCGNRKMISDVFDVCRSKGIPGNNLITEVFF